MRGGLWAVVVGAGEGRRTREGGFVGVCVGE